MNPFTDLPDEVLEAILERLSTSKDLASCSKAEAAFRKILQPTKTSWLFHEILPMLCKYLTKNDMLLCRRICSRWRSAIDKFLEVQAVNFYHRPYVRSARGTNWSVCLMTPAVIRRFLREMGSHHGNPIITRTLLLGKDFDAVENIEEQNEYWNVVQLLLTQIGSHVWCCQFSFEETPVNLMYILRGCLSHLPNLKSLSLANLDATLGGSSRRINGLLKSLKGKPFPPLPKLEHLEIGNGPSLFFDQALPQYADVVKSLDFYTVQLSNWSHQEVIEKFPPTPELESIYLSVNRDHLLLYPTYAPNLTKLVISCPQICSGELLGKMLNLCKNSLKEFTIIQGFNLDDKVGHSFTKSFPQEIPHLEKIIVLNPSQDWIENFLCSGNTFCITIQKLEVQWQTENFPWMLDQTKNPIVPSLPFRELLTEYSLCDSRWVQINEFIHDVMYDLKLWNRLAKLQSCNLSGYCETAGEKIFSTLVKREMVML